MTVTESAAEEQRKRREFLAIKTALVKAGLPEDQRLTAAQQERAAEASVSHTGLTGKSLAVFILEGDTIRDQVRASKRAAKKAAAKKHTESVIGRSTDPEATAIARAAKAMAPLVRSNFLPKDAREFLDKYSLRLRAGSLTIARTDGTGLEETFDRQSLELFATAGAKNKHIRRQLADVSRDSRLWGRKLALIALVVAAKRSE